MPHAPPIDGRWLQMANNAVVARVRATATLGELLRRVRESQNVPIDRVATLGGVLVEQVQAVEDDDHELSAVELDRLIQHYRDPTGGSRQTLGEVTLDLTAGFVAYADPRPDRQIVDAADRVLAQYVQLLYHERGVEDGTHLPIKDLDLDVLRLALSVRQPEVVKQISVLQQRQGTAQLPRGVVALGVAALTSALALGLLLGRADTPEPAPNEPEPVVEIGEAATLVRPPTGD